MNSTRALPVRGLGRVAGLAAVVGGLLLAGTVTPTALDAPEPGFSITSTLTALPDCSQTALLAPGVTRCLTYTVHNLQPVPITVASIGIQNVSAPAGCPVSNLDLSQSTFTGRLVAPARGSSTTSVDIALRNLPHNQDRCQGVTFTFHYTGTSATGAVLGVMTPNTGAVVQWTVGLLLVGGGLVILVVSRRSRRSDAPQEPEP